MHCPILKRFSDFYLVQQCLQNDYALKFQNSKFWNHLRWTESDGRPAHIKIC